MKKDVTTENAEHAEKSMKIEGHKIPISNVSNSANFYEANLGFNIGFKSEDFGWVSISKGEIEIGL